MIGVTLVFHDLPDELAALPFVMQLFDVERTYV